MGISYLFIFSCFLIYDCIDLVQQGISEKVALVANFAGAFFCGFILAYVRSWRLALALSTILPVIALAGALMNKFVIMYKQYVKFTCVVVLS